MMCAVGARDHNSFRAAARSGSAALPPLSSITYQGVFNQQSFLAGPPEESAPVAMATLSGRQGDDVWLGCFLKSCRDGQPRDATPIDVVAVLDVSGSMGSKLGSRSRLCLAKDALLKLLRQLRPDDRFGLATFTSEGNVLQALQRVGELEVDAVTASVEALHARGGTTLAAGMAAAVGICAGAERLEGRQRRLLFLTDMHDMGSKELSEMVSANAKEGLYVSFVGIGLEFNSKLAEEVTKHEGANYFCVTREEELEKVIVSDFAYNFFPVAFDVELAVQSDGFELVAVYGSPFDTVEEETEEEWNPKNHDFYPKRAKTTFEEVMRCGRLPSPALQQLFSFLSPSARALTRVDTAFPSALAEGGAVEGGLLLLRLRQREEAAGTVRLMLKYKVKGEERSQSVDVKIQDEMEPVMVKAVLLQRYVEACRGFLAKAEEGKGGLKDAVERLEEVRAEVTEEMCPGVGEELRGFLELVRRHLEKEQ